jgi:hypothetical protein
VKREIENLYNMEPLPAGREIKENNLMIDGYHEKPTGKWNLDSFFPVL